MQQEPQCDRDLDPKGIVYPPPQAPVTESEVILVVPLIRKQLSELYRRNRGRRLSQKEYWSAIGQVIQTHWGVHLPWDEEKEIKRMVMRELRSRRQPKLRFGPPRKHDFIPEGEVPRTPLYLPVPDAKFQEMLDRASEEYQLLKKTHPRYASTRQLNIAL